MNAARAFPLLLAAGLLAGACQRHDPQAEAAAAAARAAAQEQQARQMAATFDDAVAKENWRLARAQADVLLARFPQTEAAQRVRARYDEVEAKDAAAREQVRLARLWSYNDEPVEGGHQLSAAIYAKEDLDTDGSGAKPVRLIFRDHPSWGTSSYLVLQAGDFDCYGGCKVRVQVDDEAAKPMAASRPKTDEAIAMFIEDEKALWRKARAAKTLAVTFPVKAGGTRTAVFEVGGLDGARLPKWPSP
ncbi:MAG TPA: hypothetical protein VFG18_08525 [Xanthomonadaceae bacterium]|nr:hypothetical protein [Xanthomonadaceae bacterium]